MVLTRQDIERLIPYWRPEPEKEYNYICLSDWRVKTDNFGKEVLSMNVQVVESETFRPPKDFSTGSASLIRQLWPIIEAAQLRGDNDIFISLKHTGKKYQVYDISEHLRKRVTPIASVNR